MNSWKNQHGFIIGKSHIEKNIPCQDYASSYIDDVYQIAVLSDGCGSSKHSDIGSKSVVETTIEILKQNFDQITTLNPLDSRFLILNSINQELGKHAKDLNVDIKELNATLLFVAIKNNEQLLMGHLGDGFIGTVNNSKLEIKSLEKKDEEVNGTVYTTTSNAHVYFDLRKGFLKDYEGFIMMSDGSGEALVDSRVPFQKKFINSVAGILEYIGQNDAISNQKMINDYLTKISSHIQSGDDCSLSILVKENLKITSIETYHVPKPEIKKSKIESKVFDEKFLTIFNYINDKLETIHWKQMSKETFVQSKYNIDTNNLKQDENDYIHLYIKHILYSWYPYEN